MKRGYVDELPFEAIHHQHRINRPSVYYQVGQHKVVQKYLGNFWQGAIKDIKI